MAVEVRNSKCSRTHQGQTPSKCEKTMASWKAVVKRSPVSCGKHKDSQLIVGQFTYSIVVLSKPTQDIALFVIFSEVQFVKNRI